LALSAITMGLTTEMQLRLRSEDQDQDQKQGLETKTNLGSSNKI